MHRSCTSCRIGAGWSVRLHRPVGLSIGATHAQQIWHRKRPHYWPFSQQPILNRGGRDRRIRLGLHTALQVHAVRPSAQTALSKQSVLVVTGHPRFVHMRRCLRIVCTDARRGLHVRRHVRVIARLVGVRRHRAQGWGLRIVRADTGIRLRAGRTARVIARLVDMWGDWAQRRRRGGACAGGGHLCKCRRCSQGAQRSDRRCDRESLQKGFHKHGFQWVVSIHAASS